VYEIVLVFIGHNYFVLSFKEIQSLREITIGVNEKDYTVERYVDRNGRELEPLKQFQLVKNYGSIIRLLLKDLEVEQVREVSVMILPEGLKFRLSYIARRKLILAQNRENFKK